jgi:hypothetical protein
MEVAFTSGNDTISMAMANGSLLRFGIFGGTVHRIFDEQAAETYVTVILDPCNLVDERLDGQYLFHE